MKKIILDLNRKILYNYYIKKKYECGVVLFSNEVKFIRHSGCNILNSYVVFEKKECWIVNFYVNISIKSLNNRKRKILLHKKEINDLYIFSQSKGNSIIPSSVYWKNNFIKMELCLGVGKKLYDKRVSIKNKEWEFKKQKINII